MGIFIDLFQLLIKKINNMINFKVSFIKFLLYISILVSIAVRGVDNLNFTILMCAVSILVLLLSVITLINGIQKKNSVLINYSISEIGVLLLLFSYLYVYNSLILNNIMFVYLIIVFLFQCFLYYKKRNEYLEEYLAFYPFIVSCSILFVLTCIC